MRRYEGPYQKPVTIYVAKKRQTIPVDVNRNEDGTWTARYMDVKHTGTYSEALEGLISEITTAISAMIEEQVSV